MGIEKSMDCAKAKLPGCVRVLGVTLRFVQAKSRLKPIRAVFTIPCMELLVADMGKTYLVHGYLPFPDMLTCNFKLGRKRWDSVEQVVIYKIQK
jgi:hypothetical protein